MADITRCATGAHTYGKPHVRLFTGHLPKTLTLEETLAFIKTLQQAMSDAEALALKGGKSK